MINHSFSYLETMSFYKDNEKTLYIVYQPENTDKLETVKLFQKYKYICNAIPSCSSSLTHLTKDDIETDPNIGSALFNLIKGQHNPHILFTNNNKIEYKTAEEIFKGMLSSCSSLTKLHIS